MKQHYMVSEEQEDLRIDRYLSEACEELSRSYIQKLLKPGCVSEWRSGKGQLQGGRR